MRYLRHTLFLLAALLCMQSCMSIEDVELVNVNNYNLTRTTDNKMRVKVNIRLDNPNKFKIKVKKTKIMLDINGNDAGEIKLEEPVVLEKKTESDYDFILSADPDKIARATAAAGLNIALSGKVTVKLKGWVKGKAFGLGKKIQVNEQKSLSLKDLGINL